MSETKPKQYRKTVIELTVLAPIEDEVAGADLPRIAEETDEGGWVGSMKVVSTTDLDSDEVVPELKAVGNDGSFFADLDHDAIADAFDRHEGGTEAEPADDDTPDGG